MSMSTPTLLPVPIEQELEGRLRNIGKLNHWLMAVAEAITNALHAVEDSGQKGAIEVIFQRANEPLTIGGGQPQTSLPLPSQPSKEMIFRPAVENVFVRDDGVGFDDVNFRSFCKSDSLLKVKRGGKGVGRFHCLQAFERLHVTSSFREDDSWKKREIVLQRESPELSASTMVNGATEACTEVQLLSLQSDYALSATDPLKQLVDWLAEHFLAALIVKPHWLASLYIRDGNEGFELTDVVNGKALWAVDFLIRNYDFHATCYSVREGVRSDQVRLIAGGRVVDANTRPLEYYLPHLSAISEDGPHAILVRSPFLDEHVNDARNGIAFDDDSNLLVGVTAAEFGDLLAAALKGHLGSRLTQSVEQFKERVQQVVKHEAPHYRPLLLTYFEGKEFAGLSKSAKAEEILTSLDVYKRRQAANLRRESSRIAKLDAETADYQESATKLVEGIEMQKKVALAEYVALRKIILERLEHLLSASGDGRASKEEAIHDLVFPRRTDSETAPAIDHQLWIVDERLESHHYLASDKPLAGSTGNRPDLLVALDKPGAFASDPSERATGHDRIVIVEFKRALKDLVNAPLDQLPHRQMMKYAGQIIEGDAKYSKTKRPIKTSSDVRFYLYAICELSKAMLERLRREDDFILSPAGDGAFAVKNEGCYYMEYISLPKLLEDAAARNRAFFQRLGLEA